MMWKCDSEVWMMWKCDSEVWARIAMARCGYVAMGCGYVAMVCVAMGCDVVMVLLR